MDEIEIKLGFSASLKHDVIEALTSMLGEPLEGRSLFNIYFDTPDLSLRKSRWALRVRDLGKGGHEQTVKGQGKAEAGLHRRIEHNWPLRSKQPDLTLLDQVAGFPEVCREQIRPAFSTDFSRTLWLVDIPESKSRVEVVFDVGTISADQDGVLSISEMELELKVGQIDALIQVAEKLVRNIPCWLYTPSKAARGYGLLAQNNDEMFNNIGAINSLNGWVDVAGRYMQQITTRHKGGLNQTNNSGESDIRPLIEVLNDLLEAADLDDALWRSMMKEGEQLLKADSMSDQAETLERSTWFGRIGIEILKLTIAKR